MSVLAYFSKRRPGDESALPRQASTNYHASVEYYDPLLRHLLRLPPAPDNSDKNRRETEESRHTRAPG